MNSITIDAIKIESTDSFGNTTSDCDFLSPDGPEGIYLEVIGPNGKYIVYDDDHQHLEEWAKDKPVTIYRAQKTIEVDSFSWEKSEKYP